LFIIRISVIEVLKKSQESLDTTLNISAKEVKIKGNSVILNNNLPKEVRSQGCLNIKISALEAAEVVKNKGILIIVLSNSVNAVKSPEKLTSFQELKNLIMIKTEERMIIIKTKSRCHNTVIVILLTVLRSSICKKILKKTTEITIHISKEVPEEVKEVIRIEVLIIKILKEIMILTVQEKKNSGEVAKTNFLGEAGVEVIVKISTRILI